jgi:hypothetical protein
MSSRRILRAIAAIAIVALPAAAAAQPSDAQVTKDISGPKTIAITLSSKPGTKQWNSSTGAWEWVRGAVCSLRTEEPGVTLLVKGDAVYNLVGGNATYRRFRVISNEYTGMPTPTIDTLYTIINAATEELFGNYNYMKMVDSVERLEVLGEEESPWIWHSLNSVEFMVATRFHVITNNTTVSHVAQTFSVRIYRDAIDAPWKERFVSTPRERTVLGTKSYSAAEIRSMSTMGNRH